MELFSATIILKEFMEIIACRKAFTICRPTKIKFTHKAREALLSAVNVAKIKGQTVNTEHLMKSLLDQNFGRARRIFSKAGVDYKLVLETTNQYIQSHSQPQSTRRTQGPSLRRLINQARMYSEKFGDSFLSVEHLVLAFTKDNRFGKQLFAKVQLSHRTLQDAIEAVRGHRKVIDQDPEGKYDVLEKYGQDLTAIAKARKMNPVTGRRDEMETCMRILLKRTKSNPLLIGEPGVGKTAIVEGFAQLIVDNLVPAALIDCKLISLNTGNFIADVKGCGEFESKLMAALKEVADSNGQIILVIDDIHTIFGLGGTMESMNARSLLKQMLDRGEIRCISTTTSGEYRKYIEKDPVLSRRFQKVSIKQTSVHETFSILHGMRERHELHGVRISDKALTAAAVLSDHYQCPFSLPTKAIDLVDEAAAKLKVEISSQNTVLDDMYTEKVKLGMETSSKNTNRAPNGNLIHLDSNMSVSNRRQYVHDSEVTENDINDIIRNQTGVTFSVLKSGVREKLLHLEEELHKFVVGQDMAVRVVGGAIRRWRTGVSDPNRPIGSFVFLGPNGVGKTELAKAVAICLFDTEESLVRIDLSKYTEKHAVSWLIGASPCSTGYEGKHLTELIYRRPFAVILLEGIEKAHPDVLKVFLQVLDEGRVTDLHGHTVNFNNTLILMTSNVGSEVIPNIEDGGEPQEMAYKTIEGMIMMAVKSMFTPEFINRVDEFIVFRPLTRDQNLNIVRLQLERLMKRIANGNMKIQFSDAAVQHLGTVEYDPNYEAGPVKRVIRQHIVDELADRILRQDFTEGDTIYLDVEVLGNCQPLMEKLVFKRLNRPSDITI